MSDRKSSRATSGCSTGGTLGWISSCKSRGTMCHARNGKASNEAWIAPAIGGVRRRVHVSGGRLIHPEAVFETLKAEGGRRVTAGCGFAEAAMHDLEWPCRPPSRTCHSQPPDGWKVPINPLRNATLYLGLHNPKWTYCKCF
jgi:hypothetical protein